MVVRPLSGQTNPVMPVVISWAVGLAFTSTCLVAMRVSEFFTKTELISCRVLFNETWVSPNMRKYRVVLSMFSQYIIPLLITAVLYYYVLIGIRKRSVVGLSSTQKEQSIEKAKKRTVKMLIIVVTVFAITWLPVHIWHMLKFFVLNIKGSKCGSDFLYSLAYWFAVNSCCLNPFIYCAYNDTFRAEAVKWAKVMLCGYQGFDGYVNPTPAFSKTSKTSKTSQSNDSKQTNASSNV